MTHKTEKQHRVYETRQNGRTVWKSEPGSKISFYASASNGCQGALELNIAAVEGFKLKGHDRVIVLSQNTDGTCRVESIVDVSAPDFWRAFIAKNEIEVAA